MTHHPKYAFLLITLVSTIYIMRNTDLTPGKAMSSAFRTLAGTRTTLSICADIDLNEPLSQSKVDQAFGAISSVNMLRGGNPLKDFLLHQKTNDFFEGYGKNLIGVAVPWVVMLLVSLLCCISLCCNWCYIHGCCKGKKICGCCEQPKREKRKTLFLVLTAVFMAGVLGAGVAGIIISAQVPSGLKRTFCSAMNFGQDLVYGVKSDKWIGLVPAVGSIDKLIRDFDSTVNNLNQASANLASVSTNCASAKTKILDFYNDRRNDNAPRAAPDQSGTYVPDYISNLGPPTTKDTYTYFMQQEFQIINDTVVQGQTAINSAIGDLKTQQTTIKQQINSGRNQANDITTSVEDVLTDITKLETDVNSGFDGLKIGLAVFFAIYTAVAALSFIGMLLLFACKVKGFSKCLHLGWCVLILLTLIGFIFCTVLYTGSLILVEACDFTYSFINEQSTMKQLINNAFSTNGNNVVSDVFDTCLHGNGDMLAKFGLTDDLGPFSTIYAQLDAVNAQVPIDTTSTPVSKTIKPQIDTVTSMRDGLLPDSKTTVDDLTALNVAVNSASNTCTNIKDTWMLNSGNCTSSMGLKFASTNGDRDVIPSATCIGLDAWSGKSISNRYTSGEFPSSCSNRGGMSALTYVQSFVPKFETNRNSVSTLFTNVLSGGSNNLNAIESSYGTFMGSIINVLNDLKNIKTNMQSIEDSLVGKETGLLPNTNCVFVKRNTRNIVDSMCVEFAGGLYYTSAIIIILSTMSLLSAMLLFVLLKRVNLPKYEAAKTFSPSEP